MGLTIDRCFRRRRGCRGVRALELPIDREFGSHFLDDPTSASDRII